MDLGDDRGSFAHCGGHTRFVDPRTDVPDRENTRPTCLKLERRSPYVEVWLELFAGAHEPSFIEIDAAAQPSSVGIGAEKRKTWRSPGSRFALPFVSDQRRLLSARQNLPVLRHHHPGVRSTDAREGGHMPVSFSRLATR